MDKTFDEAIDGIRNAERGVEVREDIAQGMEYVKQYAEEVTGQQHAALQAAQTATEAASTATEKAAAAAESKSTAQTAAASAAQSAQSASADAKSAGNSATSAKAEADRAAAIVSTDKTLSVEGAPADAKAVGDALKGIKLPVATATTLGGVKVGGGLTVDADGTLSADSALAAYPVGSIYQTVSYASPASMFGGIWERIAQDGTSMGESDSYAAGTTVQSSAYIVHIWERMGYLLNIRSNPGSSLTITDGKTTVEDVVDNSGRYSRELPSTGTWTITVSKDGNVFTETRVVDTYGVYTVDITIEVFGVVWNYGNSSTALTRLTRQSDPYSFVNTDVTSEPAPAVGASNGTSPFDKYMPWKGMEEYNIVNGTVGAKRGKPGFSRANDTVVLIPEFYYKVVDDAANKKRYYYVSSMKISGFEKHPGSGRYVGRYNIASGYVSKTGLAPMERVTRPGTRTNVAKKGAGWYLYDYACYCAVGLLYLVEYANFNAQSKIGKGYFYNVADYFASATGDTDTMTYHTGRADGKDGATSIQYRHIENLYGDHYELVDGINLNGSAVYVCTNPTQYADNTADGYTNIGTRPTSAGYIKTLGYSENAPWAFYPSAVGGSSTTYTGNYCEYSSGWAVFTCSGNRYPGMLYFGGNRASSSSESWITSRLMYVPQ